MRVNKKRFKVKDPDKISEIMERKIDDELEKIQDKVEGNPNIQLNPKEVNYIKAGLTYYRKNGIIPDFDSIAQYVRLTRDREFIKRILKDEYYSFDAYQQFLIISSIDDVNFIKDYINSSDVSAECKVYLIGSLTALMNEKEYVQYVKSCISNEEMGLKSNNKVALIISLRNLELMKTKGENSDYGFSLYDAEIISALNNKNLELTVSDKLRLITSTKNIRIYNFALFNDEIGLSSIAKYYVIRAYKELDGMTIKEYSQILNVLISRSDLQLFHDDVVNLVMELRQHEELTQERIRAKRFGEVSNSQIGKYSHWHTYTLYEWQVIEILENKNIYLTEEDRIKLITSTNSMDVYNWCLFSNLIELSSQGKVRLIKAYKELSGITVEQYADILLQVLPDKALKLDSKEFIDIVLELQQNEELQEELSEEEQKRFNGAKTIYDKYIFFILIKIESGEKLTSSEMAQLLMSTSNKELIGYYIKYMNIFNSEDKVKLILSTGNREFVTSCIEDNYIFLGAKGRFELIKWLKEPRIIREYIEREGFLKDDEKTDLILALNDEEYIRLCLKDKKLNLSSPSKLYLIHYGLKEEEEKRSLIFDESLQLCIKVKDILIERYGTLEERKTWERRILTIKDISEVTIEELEATEKDIIAIYTNSTDDTNYRVSKNFYTKEQLLEIKRAMDRILIGIERPILGDRDSELKAFLEVVKRLAEHITYDNYAISKEGEKDDVLLENSRNMYNGLIIGTCVCAGYADILRNALACLGVEAKCISGMNKETGSGHAWNQVKIGDIWYNVDLTWERDEIVRTGIASKEMLKSDFEFQDHQCYESGYSGEKCLYSMQEGINLKNKTIHSVRTSDNAEEVNI